MLGNTYSSRTKHAVWIVILLDKLEINLTFKHLKFDLATCSMI